MNEARENQSRSSLLTWAGSMVIVSLLYLLSIGPACLIFRKANLPHSVLRGLYYPVTMLHDHTLLDEPLEAYCRWWCPPQSGGVTNAAPPHR